MWVPRAPARIVASWCRSLRHNLCDAARRRVRRFVLTACRYTETAAMIGGRFGMSLRYSFSTTRATLVHAQERDREDRSLATAKPWSPSLIPCAVDGRG